MADGTRSSELPHAAGGVPAANGPMFLDRRATAAATGFPALVDALELAAKQYDAGLIKSPARISVPLAGEGVSLSMPASGPDISIHKLVNVQPANGAKGLPTIQGIVTVCDAETGKPLCFLDGPELTGRRTAGISLLGMRTFVHGDVGCVLLIGTGTQASFHLAGIAAVYPRCRVLVRGIDAAAERAFCRAHQPMHAALAPCPSRIPDDAQVVITLTTSKQVVYNEPALQGRLIIGIGAFTPEMAEIGRTALSGSDIIVDDLVGTRQEAGDLLQAGLDWSLVRPIAAAFGVKSQTRPVVFKSVGTAAWDLAAARVALACLGAADR
jgi:1-piperideine-2-carboxylate/1-pyrroline-2-carboxylate reductase [NAD(P)H]